MLYRLTFDNVALSSAPPSQDPIELEAGLDAVAAFNASRPDGWPDAVQTVTKVTASPDDSVYANGRRDGVAKLFASVEVLVAADSESAAEAIAPGNDWLAKAVALLAHELELEDTWDLLDCELVTLPGDSPSLEP